MVLFRRILIRPGGVSGRKGAFPLDPMEYVFTEGTASLYDVMYDTVHAVPATPVSASPSEYPAATAGNTARNLVRMSDGTLYAVYMRILAGKYQIYVKKSEDDGETWTNETHISTDGMAGYNQFYPGIAVDSPDHLHVVWHGMTTGYTTRNQIWYALYDGDWQTPIRISDYANMATYHQQNPSIAVDSQDHLHVVWQGRATGYTTSDEIWHNVYTDSWAGPVHISTYAGMSTYIQSFPTIEVDSNDYLHVVWQGRATGFTTFDQSWYNKYTNLWVGPVRISTAANMSTLTQRYPSIAVDSLDRLHVVWSGRSTAHPINYQIWYATAVPPHAAGDWVTPIRISDPLDLINMDNYLQWYPSIAVDSSDYLHVLWHGKATGYLAQDVVWLAVYVVSWATPEVLQPTGRNQYANLRWSRWPR